MAAPVRKKAPFIVVGVIVAIAVVVQLRPTAYRVERTVDIAASPDAVYRRLEDLHQWQHWSPWRDVDQRVKRTYEGPRRGVGASYTWQGEGALGKGKVTIAEADQPHAIVYRVEFISPWTATVRNSFSISKREGGSTVQWTIAGERHFWSKLFGFFTDPETPIGADMERGLSALKALLERPAAS